MVDQITELQVVDRSEYKIPESGRFSQIASIYGRKIEAGGYSKLDDLIKAVTELEREFDTPEISDAEFEVLCLTSYILGTARRKVSLRTGTENPDREALRNAQIESIKVEQHVLKLVLANVDVKAGKYNVGFAKYFLALSTIFQRHFQGEDHLLQDLGVEREGGFMRGIRGAITSALLFDAVGWEVALPDPEDDFRYEADLFVRSPDRRVFAVDVTARMPEILEGEPTTVSFYLERQGKPYLLSKGEWENVAGFIRLNVPPLRHPDSHEFYRKDLSRAIGIPSPEAIARFKKALASEVKEIRH